MIEVIQGLPAKVSRLSEQPDPLPKMIISKLSTLCAIKCAKEFGKINYLMDIDTPLSNYSAGAWIERCAFRLHLFYRLEKDCDCFSKERHKRFYRLLLSEN